jgi:tRNA dimethylallyltransferase
MLQKTLIAICGATASGKTAVAIQLAQHFNSSILSFDSRQCYQELNIGVARPTVVELNQAPHYFIASHSIHDTVNAGVYEKYAIPTLNQLFEKSDTVIAVGGTGLYLNALENGVAAIPDIPDTLRIQLQSEYEINGLAWLQSEILKYDKSYTSLNDLNNVQRMLRALEVVMHTSNTIKSYHNNVAANRNFKVIKFAINLDRVILYERINNRVLQMIDNGLETEVQGLIAHQNLNALQTVGYTEMFDYFMQKTDLSKAIQLIQQHTRNYAKRQITWFKKDKSIEWITNANEIISFLK